MHDPLTNSFAEDADIALAIRLASRKDEKLVRVAGGLSDIGDQPPLLIISALVLTYGVFAGAPRAARGGASMLAALFLATAGKATIKGLLSRTRPNVLLDEGSYAVRPLGPGGGPWKSFPSGHTAGSIAVARAAARAFPSHRWGFYAAAAAVGLAQIPRGAHYPADVIAGAVIGVAADTAAQALTSGARAARARVLRRPRQDDRPQTR